MNVLTLIDADLVPPGTSAEVVADGKIFAVFNVGGAFHVLDGICAHAGGPLGHGTLHGNVVTCPWHGWQFRVDTGQHCLNARLCQATFPCRVQDGKVIVETE